RGALKQKGQIGQAPALFELRRRHVRELVVERDAMRPRLPVRGEHFVVESPGRVVVEQRHQSLGEFLCLHGRARRHPASRAGEASDEGHEPAAARGERRSKMSAKLAIATSRGQRVNGGVFLNDSQSLSNWVPYVNVERTGS